MLGIGRAVCWVAAAVMVVSAGAAAGQEPHFGVARWGMSEEQVRELVGEPLEEGSPGGLRMLVYQGKVAGKPCYVSYTFADDELVRGRYTLISAHDNENQHLRDFEDIKKALSSKMGEPLESHDWRSSQLRNSPERWGMAIKAGHLTITCEWLTLSSKVTAVIRGGDLTITTTVDFAYRMMPTAKPR
jgi:hypothetical protein